MIADLVAEVCVNTGWTWDYVEGCITLPRIAALKRQWRVYPPVRISAAHAAGIKPGNLEEPTVGNVPSTYLPNPDQPMAISPGVTVKKVETNEAAQSTGEALTGMFPNGVIRFS